MKQVLEKISVVIPCYPPDIESLTKRTIPSFKNSSCYPVEVIIALSETNDQGALSLQTQFNEQYDFDIKVLNTLSQQYAGENRNRGASIAKGEILVFFDADDEIHPQKLEITHYMFDKYKPKMLMHHWQSYSRRFLQYDIEELEIIDSKTLSEFTFGKNENPLWIFLNKYSVDQWKDNNDHPHHGHVAIEKSVFDEVQYTSKPRGQDVEFCLKVLKKYNETVFVNAKLVNYIMDDNRKIAEPSIRWWEDDFKLETYEVKNNPNNKYAILMLDAFTDENYKQYSEINPLLSKASEKEVWSYYPVMGKKYKADDKLIRKASVIEPFLMYEYFRQKGINHKIWYKNGLFILNDSLYRITNYKIYKEDLTNLYISSLRESWSHPFFGFLEKILEKHNGKLCKPNMGTMRNAGCMNKLYGLRELYDHRDEFIQDIVIPYNIAPYQYDVFLTFLREKLGNELVFKIDCIQEGRGVIFKNIEKTLHVDKIGPILDKQGQKSKEIFITPAFTVQEEFRCYFTKDSRGIKVYSIKQRNNKSSKEELFKTENIHIYKNIDVSWREIKTDSEDFAKATKIANKMIEIMSYTSGSIEFGITDKGKIVFFEVNQMAGPLPFVGEDLDNMNNYYKAIFDQMFDGL